MPLDRNTQRKILEALRTAYPLGVSLRAIDGVDEHDAVLNVHYLVEHGLCDAKLLRGGNNEIHHAGPAVITATGLDFLADDGGLGAILGIVTIKIHSDTIKELIASRLDNTEMEPERKSAIRRQLQNLSDAALKEVASALVRIGLHHVTDLYVWLESFRQP